MLWTQRSNLPLSSSSHFFYSFNLFSLLFFIFLLLCSVRKWLMQPKSHNLTRSTTSTARSPTTAPLARLFCLFLSRGRPSLLRPLALFFSHTRANLRERNVTLQMSNLVGWTKQRPENNVCVWTVKRNIQLCAKMNDLSHCLVFWTCRRLDDLLNILPVCNIECSMTIR